MGSVENDGKAQGLRRTLLLLEHVVSLGYVFIPI